MKKIFIVSLSLLVFNASVVKPAFSDTDISKLVYKIPASAVSMAAGTVAGTPIAIVRKTSNQYIGCVKEFKKDSNTYKFWGAAYSAPVAVVSGLIKGTVYGAKNAVHYSVNKPFGKDAFSLGNLESSAPAVSTAKGPNMDKPESQPWGTPK